MNYGTASPAVTDRSIKRPLASAGLRADAFPCRGAASGAVGATLDRTIEMIIAEAVNSLADSSPGKWLRKVDSSTVSRMVPWKEPDHIRLKLAAALPADAPEEELKHLMQRAGSWMQENSLTADGVSAYVSNAVNRPVLSVCAEAVWEAAGGKAKHPETEDSPRIGSESAEAAGCRCGGSESAEAAVRPRIGSESAEAAGCPGKAGEGIEAVNPDLRTICGLYMAGYAGLAGTAVLAKDLEQELSGYFPAVWLERAKSFDRYLRSFGGKIRKAGNPSGSEPAAISAACSLPETAAAQNVAEGGILAALWYFIKRLGCGLDVDLRRIPIRQETIELCERLTIHPYQLYTCGALLLAADPGDEQQIRRLKTYYEDRDMPFVRIGSLTDGTAGILRSGEEIRYLEKPQQDALAVLAQRRQSS